MASIKFYIQSKSDNSTIYLRFSDGRDLFQRVKTNEFVNSAYWNDNNGAVKRPRAINKNDLDVLNALEIKLNDLRGFILSNYTNIGKSKVINIGIKKWLNTTLETFYNDKKEVNSLEIVINYLEHYKTNTLPFRTYRGKRIAETTKKKQITIINYLTEFISNYGPTLKVSQFNKKVANQFEDFLRRDKRLAENTIGKYLKYSKTILLDAKNDNIEINPQLNDIKGFTVETPTVYLMPEELQKIRSIRVLSEKLQITRDWLIIGCHTGQRASDLFRMDKKMIINIDDNEYLNLTQKKTKTPVQIPLHPEVKEVLQHYEGNFPPVYSQNMESNKTLFNRFLKKIAKIADLDRLEKGRQYNNDLKKYIQSQYPIYEIISSHVCRRTFATTYYGKVPNQIIMAVTGHKTEREFLQYIGVDNSELSKQMFKYWSHVQNSETDSENPEAKVS